MGRINAPKINPVAVAEPVRLKATQYKDNSKNHRPAVVATAETMNSWKAGVRKTAALPPSGAV
jgi:hypothetical protein